MSQPIKTIIAFEKWHGIGFLLMAILMFNGSPLVASYRFTVWMIALYAHISELNSCYCLNNLFFIIIFSDSSEGLMPQLMTKTCVIETTSSYSKCEYNVHFSEVLENSVFRRFWLIAVYISIAYKFSFCNILCLWMMCHYELICHA